MEKSNVVFLIRHAESIGNLERNRINAQKDPRGLTKEGKTQAELLAKEIKKVTNKFSKILSSPIKRTHQTAKILSKILNIPIEVDSNLVDIDRGIVDGLTHSQIQAQYPELIKSWRISPPGQFKPPGGESFIDLTGRMRKFLRKARNNQNSIVISHQDPIIAILFLILNIPSDVYYPFKSLLHIDNATVTALRLSNNEIFIPFVNKKDNLEIALAKGEWDRLDIRKAVKNDFYCAVGVGSYSYNNNYIVRIKDDKDYFIKFFADKYLAKIKREEKILIELLQKDFIITTGKIDNTANQCYFIKPFLFRLSLEKWWRWGLSKERKKNILKLAADEIARLHNLPKPIEDFWQFPHDRIANFNDWMDFLHNKMDGDLQVIKESQLVSRDLYNQIEETVTQEIKLYEVNRKTDVVRLHGDFHLDNILLTCDKSRLEFIDFENARVGDRLWDLANFYKLCFVVCDNKLWFVFFDNYFNQARRFLPTKKETEKIIYFFTLLNFTGSLKQKIERNEQSLIKSEIAQLKIFLNKIF